MAIVDRAKQWELVKAIMEACGMPPIERVRSFRLSVSVDECMKVEVETYPQGNGNTEPLKREFHLTAIETSNPLMRAVKIEPKDASDLKVKSYTTGQIAKMFGVPDIGSLWTHAPVQAVSSITHTDAPCPDCNGTRIYRGLTEEKPCPTCCGGAECP
jgi:hypothetical protein